MARNFLKSQGLVPPPDTPHHIFDLLETYLRLEAKTAAEVRQSPLTWPDELGQKIAGLFVPVAPGEDESDPDLAVTHPYRLFPGLQARYPLSIPCREHDLRDARRQTYLLVPKGAKTLADEAVARLDAARILGPGGEKNQLDDCVRKLSKRAPEIAEFIAVERDLPSLEMVLGNLRVPVTPSATSEDVRTALRPALLGSAHISNSEPSRHSLGEGEEAGPGDSGLQSRYSDVMSDTTIEAPTTAADGEAPQLEFSSSRQFPEWLAEQTVSLAFTTYRAGKLFFIGLNPETSRLSIFERTFERCMGLTVAGNALYMSSLYQLWRFENAVPDGEAHDGYDRVFVPQVGYVTGDIDVHDIGLDAEGRVVFVNTLFSCLATVSETHSFIPIWQPPYISRLAAEDRCHLNGLAMEDGRPCYVTAVSQTDATDGWRERRRDGGVVIDVETGQIVADGLSMPHSPRVYRDKLWVHDSGTGYFGTIDTARGTFEPLAFCRGYLRGLAFIGDFAVVGLSLPRGSRTFEGLALEDELAKRGVEPMCAIQVIDLRSGDIVHWLRIDGIVEELYDVVVMPDVRRPMAIGFRTDEIRRVISVGDR